MPLVQVLCSFCSPEKVTVIIKHSDDAVCLGVLCSTSMGLCPGELSLADGRKCVSIRCTECATECACE